MFESWFLGPALVALISATALVAIGASRQAAVRREAVGGRLPDPRRVFGRKRRWLRPAPIARRLGLSPLR